MPHLLERYPDLAQASIDEKLEMVDEIIESIHRQGEISIPQSHLDELDRRLKAVDADPSLALDPDEALKFLKRK